jgi:hypothetical protein
VRAINGSIRLCEERLRRSNPESFVKGWVASLALAMTGMGGRSPDPLARNDGVTYSPGFSGPS